MDNDDLLQQLESMPPDQQAALLESLMSQLSQAEPPPPAEYRAYYREDGSIITYTMQDLPGNYIKVTQDEYAQGRHDARVIDGELVFTHRRSKVFKLERNNEHGYVVSKYDVCIPTTKDQPHNLLTNKVYDIIKPK
jgi:hypothetical protein